MPYVLYTLPLSCNIDRDRCIEDLSMNIQVTLEPTDEGSLRLLSLHCPSGALVKIILLKRPCKISVKQSVNIEYIDVA